MKMATQTKLLCPPIRDLNNTWPAFKVNSTVAVKDAIGDSGADAMINVFVDSEWQCFFGCTPTGMIRGLGTLVKYMPTLPQVGLFNTNRPNENWATLLQNLRFGQKISLTFNDGQTHVYYFIKSGSEGIAVKKEPSSNSVIGFAYKDIQASKFRQIRKV